MREHLPGRSISLLFRYSSLGMNMKLAIVFVAICLVGTVLSRRFRPRRKPKCNYGLPVVSPCDADNKYNMIISKASGTENCPETIVADTGDCLAGADGSLVPARKGGARDSNCMYTVPDMSLPACDPETRRFTVEQSLLSGEETCQKTIEIRVRCITNSSGNLVAMPRFPSGRRHPSPRRQDMRFQNTNHRGSRPLRRNHNFGQ
ncbi:hypothetical protein LOTGIDRAFT_229574 [Lottia gigantea]|uniref:Uncharacterized protein n=1 Tax=Lottia gigantea TaxID=225164 RepID=V3ZNJ7_LOTGI|nr:hypothetical protein LOTGIDRAFT_229574 [Lottia gigantea]ESO84050.1 hypothetical protein LOTGIDRAFT_229574 [Lottia gigantea]